MFITNVQARGNYWYNLALSTITGVKNALHIIMKYISKSTYCLLIMILSAAFDICAVNVSLTETSGKNTILVTPEKETGLNALYVVYSTSGLTMNIDMGSAIRPTIYKYSSLGGGYAEEIRDFEFSGTTASLSSPEGDMGYIVESGDNRYYFWLTDYSRHRFELSSVQFSDNNDCSSVTLEMHGEGSPIHFYGISGRQFELSRNISVEYNTLEWNKDSSSYNFVEKNHIVDSFINVLSIMPPPYCNTNFVVTGDRFLREWGETVSCDSGELVAYAVEAETEVIQLNSSDDKSNQIGSGEEDGLGGSAPAYIRFSAYTTDAVIHDEWQISRDSEFDNIDNRINEKEVEYEFREEGTFYIRFVGSNSDGSCSVISETYTVGIGASELVCPNAFSPGASEGVNDEWKVSYRSLIEFKCWIFDRYGNQLFHFENPDLGWDGKYRGKLVKPGVYFYVIEALGADGKKYKKSGDINILNFKRRGGYSEDTTP